jgi:hypothetical protein
MASSPKYFSVKLPCKPYIKRYCISLHGDPVPANNRTSLGCFASACLTKERYTNRSYTDSFIHKYYTENLRFQVSAWAWTRLGFDFPTAKVIELNQYLESRFEEHLHQWVDVRYREGKTERRRLIEEFAESYGIELEEDISLDALVKTEYRMRKAIERNRQKVTATRPRFY